MHAPGDVEVIDREEPSLVEPTDAVIRLMATCICGSDLHAYHGREAEVDDLLMGHEYLGVVEQVGDAVTSVDVGDPVVGSFAWSDNTCEICRSGYQPKCVQGGFFHGNIGTQAEKARVPLADGTLVKLPHAPTEDQVPHLLAASDVLGTGWFGAAAAQVGPGRSVAVVGDGAVGLMAVLAAKQMGAETIIAMSKYPDRQELAKAFGATHIVPERGEEGISEVKGLTGGHGAHSVVEAVGSQQSFMQAIGCTRPGGHMGYVGVPFGVELPAIEMYFADIHLHGGPAPVRRYLPELVSMIYGGEIEPGRVFDLALSIEEAAEGYRAMAEREAIKVLLTL
ncbi:MAG: alcohol dehydrogenase catalytic domain-containing protein [Nitriliruptorales bacterium]|nr:alcohol dehydrogenase catalytic domain-containing protein [Nitriliruptorales bacterium]